MIIGFLIAIIAILFISFFIFKKLNKKNKKIDQVKKIEETLQEVFVEKPLIKTSFELGEEYEKHICSILKESFPESEIKHVTKGKNDVDIYLSFYFNNKKYLTLPIEVKNVLNYSLSWEKKLNEFLLTNINFKNAILLSKTQKNARVESTNYWISEFNSNVIILQEENLINFIKDLNEKELENFKIIEKKSEEEKIELKRQQEIRDKENSIIQTKESYENLNKKNIKEIINKLATWKKNILKFNKLYKNLTNCDLQEYNLVLEKLDEIEEILRR